MDTFKIHPAIGIARVGPSETFYLAPEEQGGLPVECDSQGIPVRDKPGAPQRVTTFKDSSGDIKRQAARFGVYVHDADHPEGREIEVGETFTFEVYSPAAGRYQVKGTVTDIEWTVHVANKKASWYLFKETAGMHGYEPGHGLRNPGVTETEHRRRLIIDPGPQTVSNQGGATHATFARGGNPGYPQTFPPSHLAPSPIDTLGEVRSHVDQGHARLIVLGGRGHAGSEKKVPIITEYANNDGWYDDVADGPVSAVIHFTYEEPEYHTEGAAEVEPDGTIDLPRHPADADGEERPRRRRTTKKAAKKQGTTELVDPAWVVVGYPRYAPELVDLLTMEETLYDVFVRHFAFAPEIYGVPPWTREANNPKTESEWALWRNGARWNPGYYPKFFAELWPVLRRPESYQWVWVFDPNLGGDPHNTGTAKSVDEPGGPVQADNLDKTALSTPPHTVDDPRLRAQLDSHRQFIYAILRKQGEENEAFTTVPTTQAGEAGLPPRWFDPTYHPRAMPGLAGHNPLSNVAPQKFLRLTDTQLFLFSQWAQGRFVNECLEWGDEPGCQEPWAKPPTTGLGVTRGVLGNVVGGAFCPGAELTWIMLNPAIWDGPWRVKHATFTPGQLSVPEVAADDGTGSDLAAGMEPGDLTKYLAQPWQSDFTQCTTQPIDVTYGEWNNLYLDSTGDPAREETLYNVPWWPAHRPMAVFDLEGSQVLWDSGIPENNAGGLRMVTAWNDLGFIVSGVTKQAQYAMVERNDQALGPPISPGAYEEQQRIRHQQGRTKRASRDPQGGGST